MEVDKMNHFPVDLVVSIVVAVLASTGLWNWLFYRTKRKDEMMDKRDETYKKLDELITFQKEIIDKITLLEDQFNKTDKVTMSIARDRIYYLCKMAIRNKDVDPNTMEIITSLYEPYVANGGNGMGKEYFEKYEYVYKTSQHANQGL